DLSARIKNSLNVFDPNRAVVFNCVNIIVSDFLDIGNFPANDHISVENNRLHTIAADRKSYHTAAFQAWNRKKTALFLGKAIEAQRRAGKCLHRSKKDIISLLRI